MSRRSPPLSGVREGETPRPGDRGSRATGDIEHGLSSDEATARLAADRTALGVTPLGIRAWAVVLALSPVPAVVGQTIKRVWGRRVERTPTREG